MPFNPLIAILPGSKVIIPSVDCRAYRVYTVEKIRPAIQPFELDYLEVRSVDDHSLYVWTTGGYFEGMRRVEDI